MTPEFAERHLQPVHILLQLAQRRRARDRQLLQRAHLLHGARAAHAHGRLLRRTADNSLLPLQFLTLPLNLLGEERKKKRKKKKEKRKKKKKKKGSNKRKEKAKEKKEKKKMKKMKKEEEEDEKNKKEEEKEEEEEEKM